MTPRHVEVDKVEQRICKILVDHDPALVGIVLADLVARWLVGFQSTDQAFAAQLREDMLAQHIAQVRRMMPVNERLLADLWAERAKDLH